MTTHNDKTALPQSANTFTLYPISSHPFHHSIKEPEGEYDANASTTASAIPNVATLRDRLEEHLARYHFHHLSLMSIGRSEDCSDNWEFGAYLTGRALQQESELLMTELSQLTLSSKTQ